jgi:hypothetical protein
VLVLQSFVVYMVFCPPLFPLLSWSSCASVAQSFVVYMVFSPPLFPQRLGNTNTR